MEFIKDMCSIDLQRSKGFLYDQAPVESARADRSYIRSSTRQKS